MQPGTPSLEPDAPRPQPLHPRRGLHDGLSAKDASNMAYSTLKQYHGWLTSKAVGTMTAVP